MRSMIADRLTMMVVMILSMSGISMQHGLIKLRGDPHSVDLSRPNPQGLLPIGYHF